jgi:hypothetical protein
MIQYIIGKKADVRPSYHQCWELESLGLKKMSSRDWFNLLGPAVGINRSSSVLKDLDTRAEKLVDQMIAGNRNHLITMDGHGRTLYYLLKHIYNVRSKGFLNYPITLEFKEIDEEVHFWHELFFPESSDNIQIILTKGNVFDGWFDVSLSIPTNQLIYLNFCGLGSCKEKVRHLVSLSQQNKFFNLFVSVSTLLINTKLVLDMSILFSGFTPLTDRKDFWTFQL